MQLIFG